MHGAAIPKAVAVVSSTAALGVAVIQEAASHVEIPSWAFDWAQLVVVGLVGLAWWSIRKTYVDHDRRILALEKKEGRDIDRLTNAIHALEITVAELRAICPFCRGSLVVGPTQPTPPERPALEREDLAG